MATKLPDFRSYARVASKLKGRIAAGEFEVGGRLPPERNLAEFYSVSRPTIREALVALETEGIVSVRPGSGVYVSLKHARIGVAIEIDIGILDALEAIRVIEPEVCALAATKIGASQIDELIDIISRMSACSTKGRIIDFEFLQCTFHKKVAEASGNDGLAACLAMLWNVKSELQQSPDATLVMQRTFKDSLLLGYTSLIDSFMISNAAGARSVMQDHLQCMISLVIDEIESNGIQHIKERVAVQRQRYSIVR